MEPTLPKNLIQTREQLNNPEVPFTIKDIKKVLIVLSPPRGGSSLFFKLLRQNNMTYSLQGESGYLFKPRIKHLSLQKDDSLSYEQFKDQYDCKAWEKDFCQDLSYTDEFQVNDSQYQKRVFYRLLTQWPEVPLEESIFNDCWEKAKDSLNEEQLYLKLILELRKSYNEISPWYYDINPDLILKSFPDLKKSNIPPSQNYIIEEPPFVLQKPASSPTQEQLKNGWLVLKSSINNYRGKFWKNLFSHAQIKFIHLTRNPLASTNGLMDGWLHPGFYSYNVKEDFNFPLSIKGYHNTSWWNFDLPPNFKDLKQESLEEVCLEQWLYANKHILEFLSSSNEEFIRIPSENILAQGNTQKVLENVASFLGLTTAFQFNSSKLPLVQTTNIPKKQRWKERRDIILKAFQNSEEAMKMASTLGYNLDEMEDWP